MTTPKLNPLSQFSKKTARYIKIPSQGAGYQKGIHLSDSGELAVYPMTARDELMLKSPDALLNGQAVISVLRNCVPDIADPSEILVTDLDAIMVAIRMATYSDVMEMVLECSNCNHKNTVDLNLPSLLDQQTYWVGITEVEMPSGIKVRLRPYNVRDKNRMSITSFDQMNRLNQIDQQAGQTSDKIISANESFNNLIDLSLDLVARSIEVAITPTGDEITDLATIKEWVLDLSKADFALIDSALRELVKIGVPKSMNVKCDNCSTVFEAGINFNPSDFFA